LLNSRMKEKNYSIEFLRVVFTVYIVLRHTLAATGIWTDNCLWLGVEFFFVLSGFLLAMTYRPERSTGSFIVNRYIRFVPLTLLGCILCAIFVVPYPSNLLANVLLLTETGIVVNGGAANPPTWYLSVLLWGGVIYLMILRFQPPIRTLLIGSIVLLGLSSLRRYGYEPVSGEISLGGVPHRFVRGVSEMGLGCLAAFSYLKCREIRVSWRLSSGLELISLTMALLGPFAPIWHRPSSISLLVLNNAFLVALFVRGEGIVSKFFNKPFWGEVAKYALALYCTHYVTTLAASRLCPNAGMLEEISFAVGAIAVSVVVAVAARRFVEVPCTNYFQSLTKSMERGK